jgi:hypothetical protein
VWPPPTLASPEEKEKIINIDNIKIKIPSFFIILLY